MKTNVQEPKPIYRKCTSFFDHMLLSPGQQLFEGNLSAVLLADEDLTFSASYMTNHVWDEGP